MKERGILFSAPMVRALLEGRKTQTRRALKVQPSYATEASWPKAPGWEWYGGRSRCGFHSQPDEAAMVAMWPKMLGYCPYGVVGDRLWVRETWCEGWPIGGGVYSALKPSNFKDEHGKAFYRATWKDGWIDPDGPQMVWKPSIHMFRWASRITLELADVRVERLQAISDGDCEAEGVRPSVDGNGHDWREGESGWRRTFRQLFDSLNEARGSAYRWDSNPWVWVLDFKIAS